MARPKQPIKKDPPAVVRARMRMAPTDQSVVLAKMGDGTIVKCLYDGTFAVGKTDEGQEVLVTPRGPMVADAKNRLTPHAIDSSVMRYDSLVDEAMALRLKPGIAEGYVFFWVNQYNRRMSEVKIGRWQVVSRKANEVCCPYAYGDKTDDLFHMGDTILHKRDSDYAKQVSADRAYFNDPARYIADKGEELKETADRLGMKDFEQTVEASEKDAITIGEVVTEEVE